VIPALAKRPQHGSLPIPYVTAIIDGRPDFRVHDEGNRQRCAMRNLCQLCGEQMRGQMILIGFAGSVERNSFGEPPMHPDCFDFAWENCPWLNGRDYQDRRNGRDSGVVWAERPDDGQPLGVVRATACSFTQDDDHHLVWRASPAPIPSMTEWRTRG